ncbi:MAG: OmpA family protein [Geminicoccaceae bacterium]
MRFHMKSMLSLQESALLPVPYAQTKLVIINDSFCRILAKLQSHAIDFRKALSTAKINLTKKIDNILKDYQRKFSKLDTNTRLIFRIIIPYSLTALAVLLCIVYIRFGDGKQVNKEITIAIVSQEPYSKKTIENKEISYRTVAIAPARDEAAPISEEENAINKKIDAEQAAQFRQEASGSKVFIYSGFIDILFDENHLDMSPPNNDQHTIHITQQAPIPKAKPTKYAAREAKKALSADVRKIEKPQIAETKKIEVASTRSLSPRMKDLLSRYKIMENNDEFRVIVPGVSLFARNNDELSQNASSILKPIAETAQLDDDLTLTIVGHTDSFKSVDASRELSLLRAKLVRDFLSASFGIKADRMEVSGEGKGSPIASNSTLDGRQANRRVEIVFGNL